MPVRKKLVIALMGCVFVLPGCSQRVAPDEAGGRAVSSGSPPVLCTVKLNFWCIVQADATLDMEDLGERRQWSIGVPDGDREVVTILESKACDTPADVSPKWSFSDEVGPGSGQRYRTAIISMTADGACVVTVRYLTGGGDLARAASQLAESRLYLCTNDSCLQPLIQRK